MKLTATTKRKVRAAIVYLNNLYGGGKVFIVDHKSMKVMFKILIGQARFGPPEYVTFRFDGTTVFFRGHQQKI